MPTLHGCAVPFWWLGLTWLCDTSTPNESSSSNSRCRRHQETECNQGQHDRRNEFRRIIILLKVLQEVNMPDFSVKWFGETILLLSLLKKITKLPPPHPGVPQIFPHSTITGTRWTSTIQTNFVMQKYLKSAKHLRLGLILIHLPSELVQMKAMDLYY
jgi:hypothetical protein